MQGGGFPICMPYRFWLSFRLHVHDPFNSECIIPRSKTEVVGQSSAPIARTLLRLFVFKNPPEDDVMFFRLNAHFSLLRLSLIRLKADWKNSGC